MVGAITTLIVIVAVFLAYNANNGLPFVPVYRISVELPNAARLAQQRGPDRRPPRRRRRVDRRRYDQDRGDRPRTAPTGCAAHRRQIAKLNLKLDKAVDPLPAGLDRPGPLPLLVRPQVPRDDARHGQPARPRAYTFPVTQTVAADRVRRHRQHLRHARPATNARTNLDRLRRRLRRPRGLAQPGDREPQPAVHRT